MKRQHGLVWLLVTALAWGGCGTAEETALDWTPIVFAEPITEGSASFEGVLSQRRSVRDFAATALSTDELGQLFWAAQGVTSDRGGRTNPSAGGLYPLEVYAVTSDGVLHYVPNDHSARVTSDIDLRRTLSEAALGQESVADAPAVFVVCGVFARTEAKYGDRAERYVHLEAGHVGQSILLQAGALGLAGVPVGAFDDAAVREVLGLPADHAPLYLIPIGHPAP